MRDRETLVAALRERGVDYLTPTDAETDQPLDDESLIASLAAHPEARLRQALLALFLLQPQLAPLVPRLREQLDFSAAHELTAHYMAAVYLQRMWWIRLERYLPEYSELPDYFSAELGLPARDDEHGKAGLYVLGDWHAAQGPHRLNQLSAYQGVADLVLHSLKMKHRRREPSPTG